MAQKEDLITITVPILNPENEGDDEVKLVSEILREDEDILARIVTSEVDLRSKEYRLHLRRE